MKSNIKTGFIFALLVVTVLSKTTAQSGPSKQQTLDFIKTNHPLEIYQGCTRTFASGSYLSFGGKLQMKVAIKDDFAASFSIRDSLRELVVPVKGEPRESSRIRYSSISFNLKDIESIEVVRASWLGDPDMSPDKVGSGDFPYYLSFNAANGKKLIRFQFNSDPAEMVNNVTIPMGSTAFTNSSRIIDQMKESQLYKAWLHLRKLSGASDPIKF